MEKIIFGILGTIFLIACWISSELRLIHSEVLFGILSILNFMIYQNEK